MSSLIEFLIVGRTPLGSALRAGLIGVLATTLGTLFFSGSSGPFVVGAVIVVIVLPLAYLFSKRDDAPESGPAAPAGDLPPRSGGGHGSSSGLPDVGPGGET